MEKENIKNRKQGTKKGKNCGKKGNLEAKNKNFVLKMLLQPFKLGKQRLSR